MCTSAARPAVQVLHIPLFRNAKYSAALSCSITRIETCVAVCTASRDPWGRDHAQGRSGTGNTAKYRKARKQRTN